jgi:oligoendopeptidase F
MLSILACVALAADTWSLDHVFADVEAFEAAAVAAEERIEANRACADTLVDSADALATCLTDLYDTQREISLLHAYAMNHSNADTRDDAWQQRKSRVQSLWSTYDEATAWLAPTLQAHESKVTHWVADPRFDEVRVPVQRILRRAAHTLSPDEERLLALTNRPHRAAADTYGLLVSAELPWPTIQVDGEPVVLTPAAFGSLRTHPDRAVRRAAFDAFFGTYEAYQGTIGSLLATTVASHWGLARARGFDSSVQRALSHEFLPRGIVDTLVAETRAGRPTLHRYLRLRGRMTGIDDLGYHDLYVPLVASDEVYDLQRSKELAYKSAKPLGKPYVKALRAGLDGGWIDAYPREGKRQGAYMSGAAYGIHPYVLLNHTDDWSSASTLAHEMGHAMHTWLTQAHQPYPTSDYATFIAEVASTFHENLLLDYMLDQARTDDERLFYLGNRLETLRFTYFRQAMFAEFELAIHEAHERGEPLTGAALTERYGELLREMYGHAEGLVTIADIDTLEWAFVPHFHYDFYVFQYATSLAASSLLSERVLNGEKGAVERYLALLEAGGSADAHELMKTAGVDLSSPEPYRALMRQMDDIMDEMERILDRREGE